MAGRHPAGREQKRLRKELVDLQTDTTDEVSAETSGDNMYNWIGTIKGPRDTPYDGGDFRLEITIPDDYPYAPPLIRFATKVWHPNISSQTGAICLDILKKEWSPALTIRTALLSIQALLSAPEPDDPQDATVASMYKNDRATFESTARAWTNLFACHSLEAKEIKIQKIKDMGFSERQAQEALERFDYDETSALNSLLDG